MVHPARGLQKHLRNASEFRSENMQQAIRHMQLLQRLALEVPARADIFVPASKVPAATIMHDRIVAAQWLYIT